MLYITNFADQSVILPVMVLIALGLVWAGWPRAAVAWAVVVPATLGAVLLGKLLVAGCGSPFPYEWNLRSPSGHAASAGIVFGGMTALLFPARYRVCLGLAFGLAAATVIGLSRLALRVHTISDVITGGAIGIAGAMLLARLAGPRPQRLKHIPAIASSFVLVVILFHGAHLHAEAWISRRGTANWPFTLCSR